MRQKVSGINPKTHFLNSQRSSKPVAVICLHFTHMPLFSFQNNFPFSPFSDSCLSKISVKTWGDESYTEKLHATPTKF